MIIDEKAEADDRPRAQTGVVGQHETQWLDDVRRGAEQHFTLGEGLVDKAKIVLLEVAEATVDQLCRRGGRRAAEVALLAQKDRQAPPRGVAGDPAAVDATADYGEIDRLT